MCHGRSQFHPRGQGAKVSFKNTIICLTSNLGAPEFLKQGATKNGVVTSQTKSAVMEYVTAWFRPEVLGRLDDTIIFNSLPRSAVNDIVKLRLSEVQSRLDDRHITLNVSEGAIELLGNQGYSEQYGARAVARAIRDEVVAKVTLALLEGRIRNGDVVNIVAQDGKVLVKDNHERDTSQGEHVLDIVEEDSASEDANPKEQQSAGRANLPILLKEVSQHKWSAQTDGSAVTIVSETTPGRLSLPLNWLRDNCTCSNCLQASTKQRLHKSSDYFSHEALPETAVRMETKEGQVGLHVSWSGVHMTSGAGTGQETTHPSSFFPLAELVCLSSPSQYTQQDPLFFPTSTWNQQRILGSPTLRVPYEAFKSSPTALHAALSQVTSYGLVVLTGVPTDKTDDATCELRQAMEQIGELRNTFYGQTWDVKAIKDSKNIAYTDVDLGFHQDLLYFESPPRFQALHCLRNKVDGGSSYFADAFAAAERLKKEEPKMYEVLKTTQVPFHYDNDGNWYHRTHTTIEESQTGRGLHAVNYSPPFQAPLPLISGTSVLGIQGGASNDLPASLTAFDELLSEKDAQYEFTMQEGDLVFFDNRRVLHARRAFKPKPSAQDATAAGEATRWLKGCYLDGDVIWNKLRHLTRDGVAGKFPVDDRWRPTIEKNFPRLQ